MTTEQIRALIEKYAKKYGLPAEIVFGIVQAESGFNQYAVRYEEHYRWIYKPSEVKPSFCSVDTEKAGQKTSYGLMQVMGAVFREYGYSDWLSKIPHDAELQIDYGCKHLSGLFGRYGGNIIAAVLSYNAGSPRKLPNGEYVNQYYADRVLKYAKEYDG